jgi:hypothetical protein
VSIPFTQYLMPDGRTRAVSISRPPEVEAAALRLQTAGALFECEMLTTGEISFSVEQTDDEGETAVLASAICPNGPEVLLAVDQIVAEATRLVATRKQAP